jgi:hypothetical protein
MNLPDEILEADLTHYQFRLLVVLWGLADRKGVIETSVANLAALTKVKSQSHVKESLKALEAAGYLAANRRKRNRGLYTTSQYTLCGPLERLTDTTLREPLQRLTTHEPDGLVLLPNSHIVNKPISNENIKIQKVSEDVMNKSWREEQQQDEQVGGIGKLADESPRSAPPSKRETKTRGKRPQAEWTVRDVAAEFSFLVGRKFPWLPGTVNVNHLAGALGKMRKQYQTTALIELEILKMFMIDEKNFEGVGDKAPHLYKRYLAMFRTHMNKAITNVGATINMPVTEDVENEDDFVYASDGRKFDNTIVGRKYLERYEGKLSK